MSDNDMGLMEYWAKIATKNKKEETKMNKNNAALMRAWAKIAINNEGYDRRRDLAARFILDNVDDPYEEVEVGSACIVNFEGEERVAVRGESRWYLCETDDFISEAGEAVELVSKLVPESTSEATKIPLDEFADPKPGEAWLIEFEGREYEAVYWYSPIYAHWAFVENREGLKTVESNEAKALCRLAPKSTPDHPEVAP